MPVMPNVTNVSSINKSYAVYTPRILRKVLRIAARAAYRCSLVCGLVAVSGALSIAAAGSAPLVLYTFNEGGGSTVYDVSGTGIPLNLTIANPNAVTWSAYGSLKINADTMIASGSTATKVNNALKVSNAVTIDAWVWPSNTTQNGPACIFTLSKDTSLRNLTLAQEYNSYDIRLRTTQTDTNGKPSVSSGSGTLSANLTHVVYTRDASGTVTLYLNGVKQLQTTRAGNFSHWEDAYQLALGNELSGGRPWLGSFHQLAVYDHAFTATEVSQAYTAGSNAPNITTMTTAPSTSVDTVPVAVNDSASTTGTAVTIIPLVNDTGLANTPVTVSVIAGPSHGQAGVLTGNKILYAPTPDFAGSDSITYRVVDADGDIATATVSISVTCSTCASVSNKNLKLTWSPSTGGILGYYVYYGTTASTASTFASTVQGTSTSFTTSAKDLNLQTGAQVCFRVRAYNTVGVSAFSAASCDII
jgi:hypothetical protein